MKAERNIFLENQPDNKVNDSYQRVKASLTELSR